MTQGFWVWFLDLLNLFFLVIVLRVHYFRLNYIKKDYLQLKIIMLINTVTYFHIQGQTPILRVQQQILYDVKIMTIKFVYITNDKCDLIIIKRMSQPDKTANQSITIALISALGNWVGDAILFPVDTISTRLKANKYSNINSLTFLITTIKNDKFKLFKGVQLSFPAAFIPTFIYVAIYDYGMKAVEKVLANYTQREEARLLFPFFVSSFAEFICLFPYLPVDTVRTRVQMNRPQDEYKSFFSTLKQIQKKQGFSRFYKSSRIYFTCKTLYTAIQFQSFELIRYFAGPSVFWMILNTLISAAVATTLLNPLQVLITRYALVDTTKKKLVFKNMVNRIYKRQGIKGFYKGYVTELFYHCAYALFWMPLYQIVRQKYGVELPQ